MFRPFCIQNPLLKMMRQFHSYVKFKGRFGISKLLIGMQVDVWLNAHSCKITDTILSGQIILNITFTIVLIQIGVIISIISSINIFFNFSSNGCWTRSWVIFQNPNLEIKFRNISAVLFLVSIKNILPILLHQLKYCDSLSYKTIC